MINRRIFTTELHVPGQTRLILKQGPDVTMNIHAPKAGALRKHLFGPQEQLMITFQHLCERMY